MCRIIIYKHVGVNLCNCDLFKMQLFKFKIARTESVKMSCLLPLIIKQTFSTLPWQSFASTSTGAIHFLVHGQLMNRSVHEDGPSQWHGLWKCIQANYKTPSKIIPHPSNKLQENASENHVWVIYLWRRHVCGIIIPLHKS